MTSLIFSPPTPAFVHDITDVDCWAQNGSTHARDFQKTGPETERKTAVCLIF